jgi:hypothetical protein
MSYFEEEVQILCCAAFLQNSMQRRERLHFFIWLS